MIDFMYHGIDFSNETCHIPYSYLINEINNLVSLIKNEKCIKSVIKKNIETISISKIDNNRDIICHIHNNKISFSKIKNGNIAPITDEDILDITDEHRINYILRSFNKYNNAFLNNELTNKEIINIKLLSKIIEKDNNPKNQQYTIDLKLIQDAKITKTDYELKKQLSVYPQKHGIKNMTKHLKERIHKTISELPSENTNQNDVSDEPSIID